MEVFMWVSGWGRVVEVTIMGPGSGVLEKGPNGSPEDLWTYEGENSGIGERGDRHSYSHNFRLSLVKWEGEF